MTPASTYHVTRAFDCDEREVIGIILGDISSNLHIKTLIYINFAELFPQLKIHVTIINLYLVID